MVLLQAAMGLAFAFMVALFIGAIICVPTLVYYLKRRNKQFESYTGVQKFCFVAIATIVSQSRATFAAPAFDHSRVPHLRRLTTLGGRPQFAELFADVGIELLRELDGQAQRLDDLLHVGQVFQSVGVCHS